MAEHSSDMSEALGLVALALGLRQGGALGLRWPLVDLAVRTLRVRRSLQRRTWQHGCSDPRRCSACYHKTTPCKEGCRRHKLTCPPPCPPDCAGHARWCPQRQGGGLVLDDVKSKAGRRTVAIPGPLVDLLLPHRDVQEQERGAAGSVWEDHGFVFAQPNGRPVDPKADYQAWKDLLTEAGVREARLLSRPGARFRCFHRPVSPGRSPNPPCRSLGNGLSTASAVKRGSWAAMGLGSCCPGSRTG